MALRPSPFDNPNGRQSPFRRQNSASPATVRGTTPNSSPTKTPAALSPTKPSSLSPEKASPFARRPSQISHTAEHSTSPFARPSSSLSIPASPSRNISSSSHVEALRSPTPLSATPPSPARRSIIVPAEEERETPKEAPYSPSFRLDGAKSSAEDRLPEASPFFAPPSQANLRPTTQRTVTSSTATTIKQPVFTTQTKPAKTVPKINNFGGGAYNHISQPLLHSMRESFEVLDSNTTGAVNAAAVSEMLSQMGMDNTPAALRDFFPPNGPSQLNLARYLDTLSGPLTELSQPEELKAAFEAFDVDDSGQIDVSTLRDALLHTVPQPGEDMIRLSEREVDGILGEFTSRRAFGSKGLHASKAKGDVFRYRDFTAGISGSGAGMNGQDAALTV